MDMHILTGRPTLKPLRRWHRGWERAWNVVKAAYGDTACRHDGEAWQYMGSYMLGDENNAVHEFRHRALPPHGERTTHHVPAQADDWENEREPTAEDLYEAML